MVAGQILSAVSPNGSLTVAVGIVITAVITALVTTFGIKFFHYYERSVVQFSCDILANPGQIRLDPIDYCIPDPCRHCWPPF